ncbi:MAG TPA: cytochrome b/b6 domain-containing protein, partial [Negativicutes bacterium]|nr:cytochrome b/b6 domain-containing protein [Negativicutes bacterium]
GPRVLKHPLSSRLFHWGLILGFLPAALTGFVLWLKPGGDDLVNLAMRIHIGGAAVFTLSAVSYTLLCLDRVVAFVRRIFSFDDRDVGWLLVGGGYPQKMFLGKKIAVPPMGKLNSGQKMLGICLLLGGIVLTVTGWILYAFIPLAPKDFIYRADQLHLVTGGFLGLSLFAHVFLGIYNWGEFKAMFGDGTQPLAEAEDHNPVWVAGEIEPVQKAAGVRQALV